MFNLPLDNLRLKYFSQLAGFEPARGDPIGFQVQRLNHSATTALDKAIEIVNL